MFWLGGHTGWRLLDLPWVRAGLELPGQPAHEGTEVPRFLLEQNCTGDCPSLLRRLRAGTTLPVPEPLHCSHGDVGTLLVKGAQGQPSSRAESHGADLGAE